MTVPEPNRLRRRVLLLGFLLLVLGLALVFTSSKFSRRWHEDEVTRLRVVRRDPDGVRRVPLRRGVRLRSAPDGGME